LAIPTNEKCERCGEQIIEWQIGESGYSENHTYFFLCKKCSRELDSVEKANPNEQGGVVGLCTWGNIRFACWVKTGKIMPLTKALKLLESSNYYKKLKKFWDLPPQLSSFSVNCH